MGKKCKAIKSMYTMDMPLISECIKEKGKEEKAGKIKWEKRDI